ncbi:protein of unknown function [Aminobacter niigataensis]|nr:protein of unknown function [Aminobacter niigataensis]
MPLTYVAYVKELIAYASYVNYHTRRMSKKYT